MNIKEYMADKGVPQSFRIPGPQGEVKVVLWQQGSDGAYWATTFGDAGEQTAVIAEDHPLADEVVSEPVGVIDTIRTKLSNLLGG